MIEELLGRVFATRNAAHALHWSTRSYAAHVALGELYDSLITVADSLAENYMGRFSCRLGKILIPVMDDIEDVEEMSAHLLEESDWIEAGLLELSNDSESISNIIQELVAVYNKAIFLLTLK